VDNEIQFIISAQNEALGEIENTNAALEQMAQTAAEAGSISAAASDAQAAAAFDAANVYRTGLDKQLFDLADAEAKKIAVETNARVKGLIDEAQFQAAIRGIRNNYEGQMAADQAKWDAEQSKKHDEAIKKEGESNKWLSESMHAGFDRVNADIDKMIGNLIGSTSVIEQWADGFIEELVKIGEQLIDDLIISSLLSLFSGGLLGGAGLGTALPDLIDGGGGGAMGGLTAVGAMASRTSHSSIEGLTHLAAPSAPASMTHHVNVNIKSDIADYRSQGFKSDFRKVIAAAIGDAVAKGKAS
jgi:hypothetical protein